MASMIRLSAQRAAPRFARSFSVSASRKDIIQDLYISQLKAYKPAPQAKDAHAGLVRNYTAPTPPKPPTLPTDLAGELSKFDAEEPVIGSTSSDSATATTESRESAEEFLTFLESDLPKDEAHH